MIDTLLQGTDSSTFHSSISPSPHMHKATPTVKHHPPHREMTSPKVHPPKTPYIHTSDTTDSSSAEPPRRPLPLHARWADCPTPGTNRCFHAPFGETASLCQLRRAPSSAETIRVNAGITAGGSAFRGARHDAYCMRGPACRWESVPCGWCWGGLAWGR